MSRPRRKTTTGFTLMELLVVIGIAVVLMAITVPAMKSVGEGNRMTRCNAQLQQIGQALKMYHLDYNMVPPFYPVDETNPNSGLDGVGLENGCFGLDALWRAEYLGDRKTLHCPADLGNQDPAYQDPVTHYYPYYQSYTGPDIEAKPLSPSDHYNQYKYLSTRGVTNTADPDYPRQLGAIIGHDPVSGLPLFESNWHPDDTTVVTWCDWHADSVIRQGHGQYLVLFWDGSVRMMPSPLLADRPPDDPAVYPPDAAWRVEPSDELP